MNYIKLRKNNLRVENVSALTIAQKYKTPFYCYSLSQLKNNFYNFSNAFKATKPLICFSVKSDHLVVMNAKLNLVVVNLLIPTLIPKLRTVHLLKYVY